MKNHIKTIVVGGAVLLAAGLASCEDYLDLSPDAIVNAEDAFKNFNNFQGFTEELYHCVPDFAKGYWTNSFNWGEDEIIATTADFHFGHKIDLGNFWGWQIEHDGWQAGWMDKARGSVNTESGDTHTKRLWPLGWYGIRKANIGLANLDKLTDATAEERNIIEGQLLFFRAWFHFQFIQYFGGLPYIDYVLPSDEKLTLPRLSYQECADRIAEDLTRAAELLPVNWDNTTVGRATYGKNELRINKIMALGYLGKNYLWAGSPLMNYESTGSRTYNTDYCQKAADVFGRILNMVESGETQYALVDFSQYSELFYTTGQSWKMPGLTEAIFRNPIYAVDKSLWGLAGQYGPGTVVTEDNHTFSPTGNYVAYYGMANGLPIPDVTRPDAESGYDPEYPWRGRDPRFYHDIVYDGVRTIMAKNDDDSYANLYTGGSYRDPGSGSRTGYLMYKFIPTIANRFDEGLSWGNNMQIQISWMRLADIYLMYAEAAAQASGSPTGQSSTWNTTALEAVNIIRRRAGAGEIAAKFTASLDDFMSELRRERAVELAYEGHRFNDLRRWLLLTERPYTYKMSHEFSRSADHDPANPTENRVLNLRQEVILERDFNSKHYWLPLKNVDETIYLEFQQNPGW